MGGRHVSCGPPGYARDTSAPRACAHQSRRVPALGFIMPPYRPGLHQYALIEVMRSTTEDQSSYDSETGKALDGIALIL